MMDDQDPFSLGGDGPDPFHRENDSQHHIQGHALHHHLHHKLEHPLPIHPLPHAGRLGEHLGVSQAFGPAPTHVRATTSGRGNEHSTSLSTSSVLHSFPQPSHVTGNTLRPTSDNNGVATHHLQQPTLTQHQQQSQQQTTISNQHNPGGGMRAQSGVAAASSTTIAGAVTIDQKEQTRRSRAKLNEKFDIILSVLPTPPVHREVKHKVQILHYVADNIRQLTSENEILEMQLALESPRYTAKWVDRIVTPHSVRDDISYLEPMMRIMTRIHQWRFAEALAVQYVTGPDGTRHADEKLRIRATEFAIEATTELQDALNDIRRPGVQVSALPEHSGFLTKSVTALLPFYCQQKEVVSSILGSVISDSGDSGGGGETGTGGASSVQISNTTPGRATTLVHTFHLDVVLAVPVLVAGDSRFILVFYDDRPDQLNDTAISTIAEITKTFGNCIGESEARSAAEMQRNKMLNKSPAFPSLGHELNEGPHAQSRFVRREQPRVQDLSSE